MVDAGHCVSNEKEMESSIASSKSDPEPPASIISRRSNDLPSRSVFLSNRERLLLRKQALQMKKRPVLAIGIVFSFIFFMATMYALCCLDTSVYLLSFKLCDLANSV